MTFDQKLELLKQILDYKNKEFLIYLSNNSFLTCCILEAFDNPKDIQNYFNNLVIPFDYKIHSVFEQKLYIFKKYASQMQLEYVSALAFNTVKELNSVDSLKEILSIIDKLPKI